MLTYFYLFKIINHIYIYILIVLGNFIIFLKKKMKNVFYITINIMASLIYKI